MTKSGAEKILTPPDREGDAFNPSLALQNLGAVAENLGIELEPEEQPSAFAATGITLTEIEIIIPLSNGRSDEEIAERNHTSVDNVTSTILSLSLKLTGSSKVNRERLAVLAKQLAEDPDSFVIPQEIVSKKSEELLKEIGRTTALLAALIQKNS
jgi:DNA-binding CsgD family transcriptional regulator